MREARPIALPLIVALALAGCARQDHPPPAPLAGSTSPARAAADERKPSVPDRPPIGCGIAMQHVALHMADDVVLDVASLEGELVSRKAGQPPVFDDPESYVLRLRAADVALGAASLAALVRQRVAGRSDLPLREPRIAIDGGALEIAGKLHKGVWLPFSMKTEVSASDEGRIRLHATKLKTAGVPMKGLLDLLGLEVGELMKLPKDAGISADGDDLLLDTALLLPPPRMEGRVEHVAVTGQRLTMKMTGAGRPPAQPASRPLPSARNYIYFFGGSVRFGKLTMNDADMQLIDADPRTPFDFFPAHYDKQLVAGYSRNTPRQGLQVFMPDYASVTRGGGRLKGPITTRPR